MCSHNFIIMGDIYCALLLNYITLCFKITQIPQSFSSLIRFYSLFIISLKLYISNQNRCMFIKVHRSDVKNKVHVFVVEGQHYLK